MVVLFQSRQVSFVTFCFVLLSQYSSGYQNKTVHDTYDDGGSESEFETKHKLNRLRLLSGALAGKSVSKYDIDNNEFDSSFEEAPILIIILDSEETVDPNDRYRILTFVEHEKGNPMQSIIRRKRSDLIGRRQFRGPDLPGRKVHVNPLLGLPHTVDDSASETQNNRVQRVHRKRRGRGSPFKKAIDEEVMVPEDSGKSDISARSAVNPQPYLTRSRRRISDDYGKTKDYVTKDCLVDNCNSCYKGAFCIKCNSGFYTNRGKCYEKCPEGMYGEKGSGNCIPIKKSDHANKQKSNRYSHVGSAQKKSDHANKWKSHRYSKLGSAQKKSDHANKQKSHQYSQLGSAQKKTDHANKRKHHRQPGSAQKSVGGKSKDNDCGRRKHKSKTKSKFRRLFG